MIRQDHGYGSPRTNRRHLFATKTRYFCFSIRLQDNIKQTWRYNENQHVNGATDCCIFQSTALFEFAMHYTKKTTINKQILCRFQKFFFKDQKIETHLLFLDVLRLVRHFFELKNSRVRSFYLPRTHKRSSDGPFSSHP